MGGVVDTEGCKVVGDETNGREVGQLRFVRRSRRSIASSTNSTEGRALWTCVGEDSHCGYDSTCELLHRNPMLVNIMRMLGTKQVKLD